MMDTPISRIATLLNSISKFPDKRYKENGYWTDERYTREKSRESLIAALRLMMAHDGNIDDIDLSQICYKHAIIKRVFGSEVKEEHWIALQPIKEGNKWIAPPEAQMIVANHVFNDLLEAGKTVLVSPSNFGWNVLGSTDEITALYVSSKRYDVTKDEILNRGLNLATSLGLFD